ncbi:uncharacterized protein LOC135111896 isoform X2 [Scylla paramamosain]|uniref:uncharacterized protein LOC135111896 isoform X2 n=1 Tax=Scylla paramamosain TaxID=85552 RepID=UPI003083E158
MQLQFLQINELQAHTTQYFCDYTTVITVYCGKVAYSRKGDTTGTSESSMLNDVMSNVNKDTIRTIQDSPAIWKEDQHNTTAIDAKSSKFPAFQDAVIFQWTSVICFD